MCLYSVSPSHVSSPCLYPVSATRVSIPHLRSLSLSHVSNHISTPSRYPHLNLYPESLLRVSTSCLYPVSLSYISTPDGRVTLPVSPPHVSTLCLCLLGLPRRLNIPPISLPLSLDAAQSRRLELVLIPFSFPPDCPTRLQDSYIYLQLHFPRLHFKGPWDFMP